MTLALFFLTFAAFLPVATAQDSPAPPEWRTASFHFVRQGLPVGRYTVVLHADGHGFYWEGQPDFNPEEVPNALQHEIHASPATLSKLAAALPIVGTGKCETHLKKIAQTGQKTLVFAAGGADRSCEFNYSDDDRVNASVAAFQAIAATMQAGDRLTKLHRFDRLGLDAEVDGLIEQLKQGHALEPENIAPVLRLIMDDERVMERVRRKAARLLQEAAAK